MWFFGKKKVSLMDLGFFEGYVDYHNHILPAVDDGFKSMTDSLEALTYFENKGVKKIILTPHVMRGMRTLQDMPQRFEELKLMWKGSMELHLAGEYMLDAGFEGQLSQGLRYLEDKMVLVETSYFNPPHDLDQMLYNTVISGYSPVIAHPERYVYMGMKKYEELKDKDFLFQLNILSLTGYYGETSMKKAEQILDKNMYNLLGTDIHNLGKVKSWLENFKTTSNIADKLLALR